MDYYPDTEKRNYEMPIVFFKLDQEHYIARTMLRKLDLVGKDKEKLKKQFENKINSEIKKGSPLQLNGLKDIRMHTFNMRIHPAHKSDDGIYPVSEAFRLGIQLVYGLSNHGGFVCFFPVFQRRFFCYREEQVKILGQQFAQNYINDLKPEEAYKLHLIGEAELDVIRVKSIRKQKQTVFTGPAWIEETLSRNAEKMPVPKSQNRRSRVFPQNAWEQKENIVKVYDHIIKEKSNLILVGEHGVGKSAVLSEVIRRIVKFEKENKPEFWRTTPRQLISGAKYLGEWQELCEDFFNALEQGNGILWLDDLLTVFATGGSGTEDSLAAFMLPYIAGNQIKIVAELTPKELEAARRIFPAFIGHFQTVVIHELDKQATLNIIRLLNEHSSNNNGVAFSKKALEMSYTLLNRFMPYEKFPGKAINFLSTIVSEAIDQGLPLVEASDVVKSFTGKTGLPELMLNDKLPLIDQDLKQFFLRGIKGQDLAIEVITKVIKIYKAGINNPGKPVSVMLFAGPTGVGKTASTRLLSKYFFGHGQKSDPLVRLDMSEFQYAGQINRLIGSAETGPGTLIRHVRENPFCVVLFDEIEKANPVIFDALMNVFDEGILVDNFGRVSDFRNAIIIMTTNLGSQGRKSIGLKKDEKVDYLGPIKNFFRPEFFNRIDHVVTFNPLGPEAIKEIAAKELEELSQRDGFVKRNLRLKFSKEVEDFVAETGFDKEYGARPLQRTIEREITAILARFLLQHPDLEDCTLTINQSSEGLKIDVE
jgi:ATP-dependent Clp protease ATP-binding subunit ClpA